MKNKLRIVLYKKEKPATILTDFLPLVFLYSTAQNETRTHTPLPELGPEPSASTNSAIWATLCLLRCKSTTIFLIRKSFVVKISMLSTFITFFRTDFADRRPTSGMCRTSLRRRSSFYGSGLNRPSYRSLRDCPSR